MLPPAMQLTTLNVSLALVALTLALVISLIVVIKLIAHIPRAPYPSELYYTTTTTVPGTFSEPLPLPPQNASADPAIVLSVVVPCYNETARLKTMLDETIQFLQRTKPFSDDAFEILVIDDGSRDGTAELALKTAQEYKLKDGVFRVVKLAKNRGKGGAVNHGIQYTRGTYSIFADADGASKFSDVVKLIQSVRDVQSKTGSSNEAPVVAVGSRAHMVNTDAVVKRSFIRNFLMYSLHTLLFVFGIRTIKDTQCGFKLFNKAAVAQIFPYMHNERWIFDVEILILASRKHIPIAEVPISWHEVGGSKVDLAKDSINMAIDLVVIRLAYFFGIYKDHELPCLTEKTQQKKVD